MKKSTAFYIGLRYILAKKNNRFISFTSLISMSGLVLGVFAIILVMSVFNGSQGMMRDRTLITVPHGDISTVDDFSLWREASDILSTIPGVIGVSPFQELEGMLTVRGYHQVTNVRAIDPELELNVSEIENSMVQGSLSNLVAGENGIILGRALAGNLRLNMGDSVNIVIPEIVSTSGRMKLQMYRFVVAGVFDVQYTIGSDLALIHLNDSRELLSSQANVNQTRLRLKVDDINQAPNIIDSGIEALHAQYPGITFSGIDWSKSESALFNALKQEKIMMWFMLMMIVAIGAFNIVSTLIMMVSEKKSDIAILRTMGAKDTTILKIFIIQGTIVGIVGTLIGALAGILVVNNFSAISGWLESIVSPSGLYMISALPAKLQLSDVIITCILALIISFISTIFPAWKASQIMPAEVLRYD